MRIQAPTLVVLTTLALSACGVKDKIEQRIEEKVSEKVIEAAAGGEVDVETRDGKISIEGKDGQKVEVDEKTGTMRVTDEQGKTYDYAQAGDGSATVKGSDGLDASVGTEIPSDFPISLPAIKQVALANRMVQPDGTKAFTVNFEAEGGELEALAKQFQTEFEGKGLTVERSEFKGPQGSMITLVGKRDDGKLEGTAMLSTNSESPNVMVVVGWSDKTAVE